MKTYTIHWHVENEKIGEEYDGENYRYWTTRTTTRSIEIEKATAEEVVRAFDREGGDGDDTGSWSREIRLITNEDGRILYDSEQYKPVTPVLDAWTPYHRWLKNRDDQSAQDTLKTLEHNATVRNTERADNQKRVIDYFKHRAQQEADRVKE